MKNFLSLSIALAILWPAACVQAATEGSVTGTVVDDQGIAVSGSQVRLLRDGKAVKSATTSMTGDFNFFPVVFGDYELAIDAKGFVPYRAPVAVASGNVTRQNVQLVHASGSEMVMKVSAKKRTHSAAPTSSQTITKEKIAALPQGESISLPKLITTTSPGVVQGAFGQMFIRGNHANIQYQIDGVQLPDSPSNTFGDAFSPRNIDHMELITGGIPAEYGQRLGAVMNIITKTGPEKPGGSAEVNYGSYNTFSPLADFGGSSSDGSLHYFLSGNYRTTSRGLDTPQPASETDQSQGGTDAVHDQSHSNNEFAKVDWVLDNDNKLTLVGFHAFNFYEIPNYPCSFGQSSPIFQPGFQDNVGGNGPYNYVPCDTNDTQSERNAYLQAVYRHSFSERSFLQVAPYWKYSSVLVGNDQAKDLSSTITGASPSSFNEDRTVNNFGLKADYTLRAGENNLVKAGVQAQASKARGSINIFTKTGNFSDSAPNDGYFEGAYVQDDITLAKPLILNAGLRFDATQFNLNGDNPTDYAFQPRVGLTWLVTDSTKLHAFYGRLFQPAPVENLRVAFSTVGGGQLSPYDIKAEKDNYYEVGVAQHLPFEQTISANVYYKDAENMLDDAQLLNTSIAQPYNFATGFAYGVEVSLNGKISDEITDYANYSYEIAKGRGISGGVFAFDPASLPSNSHQFLDHVQVHTVNAGVTWSHKGLWLTGEALFGSGLRTGDANTLSLPSHLTFDASVGYDFTSWSDSWLAKTKVSFDVLNITNNVYPISIANGFNGSHYAAPREFFVHLIKEI